MAAGDVDVRIVTDLTTAAIDTAVTASIESFREFPQLLSSNINKQLYFEQILFNI